MRLAKRTGLTVATIAAMGVAMGAAIVGGAAWTSRDHDPRIDVTDRVPRLTPVNAEVRAASSCDDLLAHYIDNTIDLVGPYGWYGHGYDVPHWPIPTTGMEDSAASSPR